MLVSRDEQSVLVVSYKDVKACVASGILVRLPPISPSLLLKDLFFWLPRELSQDKQRGPPPVGK